MRRAMIRGVLSAVCLGLLASCSGASAPCPAAPQPGEKASAQASVSAAPSTPPPPTVDEARAFLAQVDKDLRALYLVRDRASWVKQTFITDDTDQMASSGEEATMAYLATKIKEARRFDGLQLPEDVARQLLLLKLSGSAPAPDNAQERSELASTLIWMDSTYGKGEYCPERLKGTKKPCLTLTEASQAMAKSRKYDELLEAWTGWHSISRPMRPKFSRYVQLANKGSKEIGFEDMGAYWRSAYDMPPAQFEQEVERLWTAVKPLYDDLHCYVRNKLSQKYGADKVPAKGPIPAHLLGNMWAQEWSNIYDLVAPYPGEPSFDVSKKLEKTYKAKQMVQLGEKFFTSLGMDPLPETFWQRSLFTKPQDRKVVCHASAWDIGSQNDLRIKMCIEPKEEDLITIHHELGHIYYYHNYYTLPILYQSGANDGFHEGIGDTLALSVTPSYLKDVGLLDRVPNNDKARINFLMQQALDKVAFLPFGLVIDKWRWDVFAGKISPEQYNQAWWALRTRYQGITPPVARTESDFDPGAKYHIPGNVPYMRYFLARILQYQFHRALCKAGGYSGPLDSCSIYGNKQAGEKLIAMLKMGASQPWPEAMKTISGETQMDPQAMIDYFAPLRAYLQEQNKGQSCGWSEGTK